MARSDGGGQRPARPIPTWSPRMVRFSYASCGSARKRGLALPPLRLPATPAFRRLLLPVVRPAQPDSLRERESPNNTVDAPPRLRAIALKQRSEARGHH